MPLINLLKVLVVLFALNVIVLFLIIRYVDFLFKSEQPASSNAAFKSPASARDKAIVI